MRIKVDSRRLTYKLYLKMLHEDGDNHVDEDELRHQHEDDEEHWRYDTIDTAVTYTVGRVITLVT